MAEEILIRDAAPGELAAVAELVKTAYQEFKPLLPEFAWGKWTASIEAAIHSGAGMLVVAEADGKIQGAVKFFPDAPRRPWASGRLAPP